MNNDEYKKYYEKLKGLNENIPGKVKSVTLVIKTNSFEKKIFKWFFKPNGPDFYITFPYFSSDNYHCGKITIPKEVSKLETFDAVKNGIPSKTPVKFSYHRDGRVHFKPTYQQQTGHEKAYKLAEIAAPSLDKLQGNHIFTINFEGFDKFATLEKHRTRKDEAEAILPIPEGIVGCKILAYAGPTLESISNTIRENTDPWFTIQTTLAGQKVYIGIYALLFKESHIKDGNKNGLVAFVGFDPSKVSMEEDLECLYLFAR